jgi:hypothetical protein
LSDIFKRALVFGSALVWLTVLNAFQCYAQVNPLDVLFSNVKVQKLQFDSIKDNLNLYSVVLTYDLQAPENSVFVQILFEEVPFKRSLHVSKYNQGRGKYVNISKDCQGDVGQVKIFTPKNAFMISWTFFLTLMILAGII